MSRLLVIGYGNELRRDDGVGPHVACLGAAWQRPDALGLAVHQLTPELVQSLADVERVAFVDAADVVETTVAPLHNVVTASSLGHTVDPGELLALTRSLYGRHPKGWLNKVSARDMGFGEGLSATALHGVAAALHHIQRMAG